MVAVLSDRLGLEYCLNASVKRRGRYIRSTVIQASRVWESLNVCLAAASGLVPTSSFKETNLPGIVDSIGLTT